MRIWHGSELIYVGLSVYRARKADADEWFRRMTNVPLVYVVIVNYNGKSHLEYSLDSILNTEYDNYEVVVVDNNSSDGSVDYIDSNHPGVTLIELDENKGVPAGNNVGVRYAIDHDADFVLIANNDIRVHPEWMSGAVEVAQLKNDIGFVGFDVHGAVRKVPLEEYQESVEDWSDLEYEFEDGFVDSMAVLVKREVFENVGFFDEEYFIYGDETDLEVRARMAGYRLAKTNIPVWHHSMGTMDDTPLKSAYLAIRNQLRLSIKHDSFLDVLRTVAYLYNIGCNPFLRYDEDHVVVKRRRPRGVIFNFALVTYSVIWNVYHLPTTLQKRRHEHEMIDGLPE